MLLQAAVNSVADAGKCTRGLWSGGPGLRWILGLGAELGWGSEGGGSLVGRVSFLMWGWGSRVRVGGEGLKAGGS